LTCRERHLKCDEVYPVCSSCSKGSRQCQWGLRIRYDKPDVRRPRILVKTEGDYHFKDESVTIASEYLGGVERYGLVNAADSLLEQRRTDADNTSSSEGVLDKGAEGDAARDSYSPPAPIGSDVELTLMRVFVEEMGAWMDTMNSIKYVSSRGGPNLSNLVVLPGSALRIQKTSYALQRIPGLRCRSSQPRES
jgi:hypothetical protein